MNLYEINRELNDLILSAIDGDGVIQEGFEADIDELAFRKEEKLLNCAKYIKNEQALADMIKAEEQALASRRKAIEARIEWMKKYVLSNMEAGEKVADAQAQIGTRKSEAIEIIEETLVPKELCNHIPEMWKVDKTAIKKAIKSGVEVSGAKLVERLNLSIK